LKLRGLNSLNNKDTCHSNPPGADRYDRRTRDYFAILVMTEKLSLRGSETTEAISWDIV